MELIKDDKGIYLWKHMTYDVRCILVSNRQVSSTRSSLRSARFQERLLIVPRTRTKTIGPRGFFHASPAVWNSLPDDLRDPELSIGIFRNRLKTFLFSQIWCTTFLDLVVHLLSFHLFFIISSIVCRARQRDILLAGAFEMSWWIDWLNIVPIMILTI